MDCAPVRVCILNSSYEGSDSAFRDVDVAACDPGPYLRGHEVQHASLRKGEAAALVPELAAGGVDVFFNLCDGAADEDRAGLEVVEALEACGAAFTGAGSGFYEPTRRQMKEACARVGVRAPAGVIVDAPGPVGLRPPLIVKHPAGYGSIGLTRASVVRDAAALDEQVARMVAAYGGALVEEFVAGREFTVLVAEGPVAYLPVEVGFPPGETFKHFDLKWVEEGLTWHPVRDGGLDDALRRAAVAMFEALEGDGYARVDLRVDVAGTVFALEINPNCGVFYPPPDGGGADVVLGLDPAGHPGFADHVLRCALARRERMRVCGSAS